MKYDDRFKCDVDGWTAGRNDDRYRVRVMMEALKMIEAIIENDMLYKKVGEAIGENVGEAFERLSELDFGLDDIMVIHNELIGGDMYAEN